MPGSKTKGVTDFFLLQTGPITIIELLPWSWKKGVIWIIIIDTLTNLIDFGFYLISTIQLILPQMSFKVVLG
jgi:hypothetical protein